MSASGVDNSAMPCVSKNPVSVAPSRNAGDQLYHRIAGKRQVVLAQDGVAHGFTVARHGPDVYVDSARGPVHLVALSRFPEPSSAVEQGSLVAPMPGNVIRIGAEGSRARTSASANTSAACRRVAP